MTAIIAFFTTTAIGRALAKIGALVLAVVTFGEYQRRKGRKAERADRAAKDAKATIQAHKERDDVEADVARGGDARDRLRADWKR